MGTTKSRLTSKVEVDFEPSNHYHKRECFLNVRFLMKKWNNLLFSKWKLGKCGLKGQRKSKYPKPTKIIHSIPSPYLHARPLAKFPKISKKNLKNKDSSRRDGNWIPPQKPSMDYRTCLPTLQEDVWVSCNMEKICCYQHLWSLLVRWLQPTSTARLGVLASEI